MNERPESTIYYPKYNQVEKLQNKLSPLRQIEENAG